MSFKRIVTVVELIAVVAVAVFVIGLFTNEPDVKESSSPGATIYAASCARCHGADGSGGNVGVTLAGSVVDEFPDVEDQNAVVADGRGGMPSFAGDLTAEEIEQVVEYTRTDLGS